MTKKKSPKKRGSATTAMYMASEYQVLLKKFKVELEKKGLLKMFNNGLADIVKKHNPDAKAIEIFERFIEEKGYPISMDQQTKLTVIQTMEEQVRFSKEFSISKIILTFTKNDELCDVNQAFCYSMKKEAARLKIFKELLDHTGDFFNSRKLMEAVGAKNYKSLTQAIGKINERARIKLHLPKDSNLIISNNSSGYMINSIYKIRVL